MGDSIPHLPHFNLQNMKAFPRRDSMFELNQTGFGNTTDPSTAQTFYKQFYKTRLCPHHLVKFCRRGDACTYAHSINELHVAPDLYKTKICHAWQTGCCNDPACRFAHGWKELRATDHFYKTRVCHFWLAGACNIGEACRHAHECTNTTKLFASGELADRENPIFSSSDQWDASTASSKSLNDSNHSYLLTKGLSSQQALKHHNVAHTNSNNHMNSQPTHHASSIFKNNSVPKDLSLSMSSLSWANSISQHFNLENPTSNISGALKTGYYDPGQDDNSIELDAISKMIEILKLDDASDHHPFHLQNDNQINAITQSFQTQQQASMKSHFSPEHRNDTYYKPSNFHKLDNQFSHLTRNNFSCAPLDVTSKRNINKFGDLSNICTSPEKFVCSQDLLQYATNTLCQPTHTYPVHPNSSYSLQKDFKPSFNRQGHQIKHN